MPVAHRGDPRGGPLSAAARLPSEALLERVRALLAGKGLDGWLLFDFRGLNPVASRVLGLERPAVRRLFVLLPAVGRAVALAHRLEVGRLGGFPGEVRPYSSWRDLERELGVLLAGRKVAMEYSARDGVPDLDRVPAGILELVRAAGARVESSADLVTAVVARLSPEEMADHRRAAELVKEVSLAALGELARALGRGEAPTELWLRGTVLAAMDRGGLVAAAPPFVAAGEHSADPGHEPGESGDGGIGPGQVVLLGVRGGVAAGAVSAAQTWAAFVGGSPPAEVARIFEVVRAARDQAVAVLRDRWREGWSVSGADLDEAALRVVRAAGFEEALVHGTGSSIGRGAPGWGPHLDGRETRDERVLAPGVAFSVGPGLYLGGRFGVRSEVSVILHEDGPEVTPRGPQRELVRLDAARG